MTALRELLARFTVEVDPEGNLPRGNRAVDALRDKLQAVDAVAGSMGGLRGLSESLGDVRALLGSGGAVQGLVKWNQALAVQERGLVRVGSSMPDLVSGIGKLSDYFPGTGFAGLTGNVTAAGKAARGAFSTFASGLSSLIGPAALATFGVGALTNATFRLVDSIGGIGEAAAKLGVTNAEFQRLDVLARQNATSVESLGTAFRTLATAAVDPSADATAAFRQLGVEARNADGSFKERNDLFFETAGALADIEDSTLRATLAQKLYGRGALELSALLASGREGLEAQRAELERLPVLTDDVIAKADAFGDSWEYLKTQLLALAGPVLGDVVIPALQWIVDALKDNAPALQTFGREALQIFKTMATPLTVVWNLAKGVGKAFEGLFKSVGGGNLRLEQMADVLGRIGVTMATLATFPLLLAQDFQTYLAGGDSAIGRGIEALGTLFSKAADIAREAFADFFGWVGEQLRSIPTAIAGAITPDVALNLQPTAGPGGLLGMSAPVIPVAAGERQGTTVIDNSTRSVQVNMSPGTSPAQVADAVSKRLEADRNSIVDRVP